MKPWHMLICAALVVAGIVLVAVGADAFVLVPALACAAMMGAMMWMMRGGGSGE